MANSSKSNASNTASDRVRYTKTTASGKTKSYIGTQAEADKAAATEAAKTQKALEEGKTVIETPEGVRYEESKPIEVSPDVYELVTEHGYSLPQARALAAGGSIEGEPALKQPPQTPLPQAESQDYIAKDDIFLRTVMGLPMRDDKPGFSTIYPAQPTVPSVAKAPYTQTGWERTPRKIDPKKLSPEAQASYEEWRESLIVKPEDPWGKVGWYMQEAKWAVTKPAEAMGESRPPPPTEVRESPMGIGFQVTQPTLTDRELYGQMAIQRVTQSPALKKIHAYTQPDADDSGLTTFGKGVLREFAVDPTLRASYTIAKYLPASPIAEYRGERGEGAYLKNIGKGTAFDIATVMVAGKLWKTAGKSLKIGMVSMGVGAVGIGGGLAYAGGGAYGAGRFTGEFGFRVTRGVVGARAVTAAGRAIRTRFTPIYEVGAQISETQPLEINKIGKVGSTTTTKTAARARVGKYEIDIGAQAETLSGKPRRLTPKLTETEAYSSARGMARVRDIKTGEIIGDNIYGVSRAYGKTRTTPITKNIMRSFGIDEATIEVAGVTKDYTGIRWGVSKVLSTSADETLMVGQTRIIGNIKNIPTIGHTTSYMRIAKIPLLLDTPIVKIAPRTLRGTISGAKAARSSLRTTTIWEPITKAVQKWKPYTSRKPSGPPLSKLTQPGLGTTYAPQKGGTALQILQKGAHKIGKPDTAYLSDITALTKNLGRTAITRTLTQTKAPTTPIIFPKTFGEKPTEFGQWLKGRQTAITQQTSITKYARPELGVPRSRIFKRLPIFRTESGAGFELGEVGGDGFLGGKLKLGDRFKFKERFGGESVIHTPKQTPRAGITPLSKPGIGVGSITGGLQFRGVGLAEGITPKVLQGITPAQAQKQRQGLGLKTPTPQITETGETPPPPPPFTPFIPKFPPFKFPKVGGLIGGAAGSGRGFKTPKGRLKYKYRPSILGIALGKTIAKPPKSVGPLEIRFPVKRKRKKKNARRY